MTGSGLDAAAQQVSNSKLSILHLEGYIGRGPLFGHIGELPDWLRDPKSGLLSHARKLLPFDYSQWAATSLNR